MYKYLTIEALRETIKELEQEGELKIKRYNSIPEDNVELKNKIKESYQKDQLIILEYKKELIRKTAKKTLIETLSILSFISVLYSVYNLLKLFNKNLSK